MKITEVRIRLANDESVKAYASICFDDCFLVFDIKVIKAPTGLFISFPTKNLSDGTHWDIAFPDNTETRNRIEQAILAEDRESHWRWRPSSKRSLCFRTPPTLRGDRSYGRYDGKAALQR